MQAYLKNKRNYFSIFSYVATVILLVFYSGGPLLVILDSGLSEQEKNGIAQVSFPIVRHLFSLSYLIILALLIPHKERALSCLRKNMTFVFPLLAWALLSTFWSGSPNVTFSRWIALFGTTIFGFYISSCYTIKEQLRIWGGTFSLIVLMSFVFCLLIPKYGIMPNGIGEWRGIYAHKNMLGVTLSIGAPIIFLNYLQSNRASHSKRIFFLFSILAVFLLAQSQSISSMIVCSALFSMIILLQTLSLEYRVFTFSTLFIAFMMIIGSFFVYQNAGDLIALTGKSSTLTGRIPLWIDVIDKVREQPWLGYGYKGFWLGWESESADVWYARSWEPWDAHNGLLELLLSIGICGALLFLRDLITSIFRSLYVVRSRGAVELMAPLLIFLHLIFSNVAEAFVMDYNHILWVLYSASIFSVSSYHCDNRIETHSASHPNDLMA